MAYYDYKCPECGLGKTVSRPISAPEEEYRCDSCNSVVSRVYYSNLGISFKGNGFYSTDK